MWALKIALLSLLTTCFSTHKFDDDHQINSDIKRKVEIHSATKKFCEEEDAFFCTEKECIPPDKKCNGVAECSNGKDESVWECGCLPNEFFCNGTCIDSMLRCDTRKDCDDGTDEMNCEMYECPYTHFKCNNHFCIPGDLVCNFMNDCGDNSDEQNCYHRECWFGEFSCHSGQCIRVALLCDGERNCLDGSDEAQCDRHRDHVECGDKSLVHRSFWCDKWPDCKDNHADELNCRNCTSDEYQCSNTRCIAQANVCDMVCDCAGTCEDEKNCDSNYVTIDDIPVCELDSTIYCQKSGRCIHKDFLCDNQHDCQSGEDGSDEYHCFQAPDNCTAEEYACPDGRCLPKTVRCDFVRDCVGGIDEENCVTAPCNATQFRCSNGQCINESLRCNTFYDCRDRSDEMHCEDRVCPDGYKNCSTGQCIPQEWWCDFRQDCRDGSDEDNCEMRNCTEDEFRCNNGQCIPQEYFCYNIGVPRSGCADSSHLLNCREWVCPSYLHKCLYSYCINDSLVCNGQIDCWGSWTDEIGCPFVCSNEYRCECRDISINCTNLGLTALPGEIETEISKYILTGNKLGDSLGAETFAHHDGMSLLDLNNNSIKTLPFGVFKNLWRLRILYLHNNNIENLTNGSFYGLTSVATINLQKNKIKIIGPFAFYGLSSLKSLDLSYQRIENISQNAFLGLRALLKLNLSNNKIRFLTDGAFNGLSQLLSLDLSHNRIEIMGSHIFHGLTSLQNLVTDEFRFCCLARHVNNCLPKADEFSSCEDLMSNIVLRVCIWVLGLIAFTGNILVIVWRMIYRTNSKVHSLLITNLAIGDMCMGIYLLIIAVVDAKYRGVYFIYDSFWRTSELCQFAGFVSTFSSELSVFTLTVITLDRFVGIAFPFRMKRLQMKRTRIVMLTIWIAVIFLASFPLIDLEYFQHFYGRSGVCLALHVTHEKPSGWEYSVFIFLVLNFLSFFIISAAYLWMFLIARRTQKAVRSPEAKRDNTMAKRMSLIVFTDFCCWMPIIVLGILSLSGVTIPPQVFAWIAVFILPLNAAVNPVLYTLSTAPFLAPTRKRVSRFRRSFMTSFSLDTGRTSLTIVESLADERYCTELDVTVQNSQDDLESRKPMRINSNRENVHANNFNKRRMCISRKPINKWYNNNRNRYYCTDRNNSQYD